ncbi:hypothetical protein SAMN05443633_12227 [Chryseobacterium arachidis]|uniref:Lipoprotein n=1 Tax=Chryseobacterium arachidis TaxID=1416778 RepID=A0A1M5MH59_9FLAO|nr:hypothetical protein [Chryseobacterium arachidis]SHG76675.1 hypothetical protein SAMN05443633_12227 [Chryseobacterium arachidis]
MKSYLIITLATFSIACTKIKNNPSENINITNKNIYSFKEIGNSLLPSTKFAKKWYVQIYNESDPMSKSDSLNQKQLENLDFFDSITGKKVINKQFESDLLYTTKEKIDSVFQIGTSNFENKKLYYIKSYKTIYQKEYDFPPTEKRIDLLVYEDNKLFKKINIYSAVSYPFAKKLTIGYLNKFGILYTKSFSIDEEGVVFLNEQQQNLNKSLK